MAAAPISILLQLIATVLASLLLVWQLSRTPDALLLADHRHCHSLLPLLAAGGHVMGTCSW